MCVFVENKDPARVKSSAPEVNAPFVITYAVVFTFLELRASFLALTFTGPGMNSKHPLEQKIVTT